MVSMTLEVKEKFPYRPFDKYSNSRWGGNNMADDNALLLSENAIGCESCGAPTVKEYLKVGICPDCDGRAEEKGFSLIDK